MTDERKAEWQHANDVLKELSSGSYVITDDASDKTPSPSLFRKADPVGHEPPRRGDVRPAHAGSEQLKANS